MEGREEDTKENPSVNIVELKIAKSRKKAADTRARNKSKEELRDDDPNEDAAKGFLDGVESTMDETIESVYELANAYQKVKEFKEMTDVLKEI